MYLPRLEIKENLNYNRFYDKKKYLTSVWVNENLDRIKHGQVQLNRLNYDPILILCL